jgi:hypothetical protein
MKNAAIWIVVLLAIGAGGYWYYRKQKAAGATKPAAPATPAATASN